MNWGPRSEPDYDPPDPPNPPLQSPAFRTKLCAEKTTEQFGIFKKRRN